MIIVVLAAIAVLVLYIIGFYNRLKTYQVRIRASIQEIGNQLKRQAGLIPNLVDSVKGYMKHEKGIFDNLTDARKMISQAVDTNDTKKLDQSQELIGKALGALRVVVESNPEIKASNIISNLMNELRDTADKIMYARRTLIDLTADYNTAINTIPGVWFASAFGFREEKGLETALEGQHLEVTQQETKNPDVNL